MALFMTRSAFRSIINIPANLCYHGSKNKTQVPICLRPFLSFLNHANRHMHVSNALGQKKIPVGVIGAGRVATQVYLNNILHNTSLDLKWIVEKDEEKIIDTRKKLNLHEHIPFFDSSNLNTLLSESSLGAVFIFASTPSHPELIDACLKKGKAVFVEKPTSNNTTDVKILYELAEKMGKPLFTSFNRRFDGAYQNVYKAYKSGEIGELQLIRATSRDSPRPYYEFIQSADSVGCSMVSDLCIHDIDQITWMTNCQRPESVYTVAHAFDPKLQQMGEQDTLGMIIKYKSGVIASIDAHRDARYGYDIRLELFGTEGMASVDNPHEASSVVYSAKGAELSRLHYSFPQRFEKSFVSGVQHFVECVQGSTKPLVTKEECLLNGEIIDRGSQSVQEGRVVYFDE